MSWHLAPSHNSGKRRGIDQAALRSGPCMPELLARCEVLRRYRLADYAFAQALSHASAQGGLLITPSPFESNHNASTLFPSRP